MSIKIGGIDNPTQVIYNGTNLSEVWYKSSPSATAVKVWPDFLPTKNIYISQPKVPTTAVYKIGNYDKDMYGQITKTNWERLVGASHPWGSFIYKNIGLEGSYIVAKYAPYNQIFSVTTIDYLIPNNIKGLSIHGTSAQSLTVATIEDGYIIPSGYIDDDKVKIPTNRTISTVRAYEAEFIYYNNEIVTPTLVGNEYHYDIKLDNNVRYVIQLYSGESIHFYWQGEYITQNIYRYYSDDFWEANYN